MANLNYLQKLLKNMNEKQLNINEYVEQMALLLNLAIAPEYQNGVVENFTKIQAIAQLVNEFSLPDNIEASPIFEP